MAYMDDVKQLYQQQLGREADAGGLEYFTQQMNNGWSVNDVVGAMQNSTEGQALNPGLQSMYEPPEQQPAQNQYGYDPTAAINKYNEAMDPYARFREDNPDAFKGPVGAPVDLGNGLYGSRSGENGVTISALNAPVESTVYTWTPDGKGGHTPTASIVEAPGAFSNFLAQITPVIVGSMFAGAAGVGPFSPGQAGAAGAAGAVEGAGWTSGYDLAGGAALPTGVEAGLNVGGLGLDQYVDGWPDLETLGTTAEGSLAYPGQPGYIPPGGIPNVNPGDYSNEGRNYPTPESTANSPTVPGAPTVPLTPAVPNIPSLPNNPSIPKIPGAPTLPGGPKTTSGNGMDLGTILSLLYGAYGKNKMSKQFEDILGEMRGMYKPGSPEAELMRKRIEARDAMKGRRSQYGVRETELAGMLADSRMRMLSSPGFMTMQAAQMNNDPSMNGLSEIFGALSKTGGPLNGLSLSDLLNTGILDGEGWTVDAKDWITKLFD